MDLKVLRSIGIISHQRFETYLGKSIYLGEIKVSPLFPPQPLSLQLQLWKGHQTTLSNVFYKLHEILLESLEYQIPFRSSNIV